MSVTTAMLSVPKPAPALIDAFRSAPTSVISDNLARLPGAVGLRPFHRTGRLVGAAFTVRTRPGDNLAIHRALELAGPGDVIVVDGGGDETRALVGEIMKNIAQYRGAAGYVIDGAIRDVAAFAASDFPCFACAVIHRGPYKSGPGEINVPVSIGGSVIAPPATSWWATRTVWCPFPPRSPLHCSRRSAPRSHAKRKPSSRSARAATRALTEYPDR
jgi:regulator of RNase E activity RraA